MSIIAAIILTIIYVAYILLWFIGCGFATFSFMEATVYKKDKKNSIWDAILFLSILTLCFSGIIEGISIGDIIDKIRNLW